MKFKDMIDSSPSKVEYSTASTASGSRMNDVWVPEDVYNPPNWTAGWASEKSGLQLLDYVGGK